MTNSPTCKRAIIVLIAFTSIFASPVLAQVGNGSGIETGGSISDSISDESPPQLLNELPNRNFGITFPVHTWIEVLFSVAVLVFGFLVLRMQVQFYSIRELKWDGNVHRSFVATLVIIAGLFLISAGFNQDQIAPVIGLLGTVVGYVLGSSSDRGGKEIAITSPPLPDQPSAIESSAPATE